MTPPPHEEPKTDQTSRAPSDYGPERRRVYENEKIPKKKKTTKRATPTDPSPKTTINHWAFEWGKKKRFGDNNCRGSLSFLVLMRSSNNRWTNVACVIFCTSTNLASPLKPTHFKPMPKIANNSKFILKNRKSFLHFLRLLISNLVGQVWVTHPLCPNRSERMPKNSK